MNQIQEIIQLSIKGDCIAQKHLYYFLSDELLKVAYRYAGESDFARDIVQNTFIRIFNNLESYNAEIASLSTWAKKYCVFESISFLRKHKKIEWNLNIDDVILPFQNSQYVEDASIDELREKLKSLPEEHRTIINLYYFDELSHKEIAALLNIKEVSSRSRLSRAREHLKINWKAAFFLF